MEPKRLKLGLASALFIGALLGLLTSTPTAEARAPCEYNVCVRIPGNCDLTDIAVSCAETEFPPFCKSDTECEVS